jgi:5'-nucleotidase
MNTKRKTIAIDMDGVIADTVSHFIAWYERDFGVTIAKSAFDNVPESEGLPNGAVRKFVHTPGFFRTIPVMAGAREAVLELTKKYDVFIVSAAIEFPQSLIEKYDWLQQNFPFISWKNIVFCGDKSVIGTDYMIDDHVRNLDTYSGKCILFSAGHNIGIDRHARINNWNEAIEFFNKESSNT